MTGSNVRPSDRAIAQAFWEYREDNAYDYDIDAIVERAEVIDATAALVVVGEGMVERMVDSFWAEMPEDERADPEWRAWAKAKMRAALAAALAGD